MILVDNRTVNLVAGYDRVRKAMPNLRSKWRGRLLESYARRRAAYDAAKARHRQQMANLKPKLGVAAAAAGLLFLAGMFMCVAISEALLCAGFLLAAGGLLIGLLTGAIWLWKTSLASPRRPQHPLREPLKSRLFPPLLPRWRNRLAGRLPGDMPYDGAIGEHSFVQSLQMLPIGSSYVLYRLQQRHGDDVDMTVVGPKGIWVFEVKYWNGRIVWQDGWWEREKTYHGPGGTLVTEPIEVGQPPDQQWQRMADDIAETLRRRAPNLVTRLPAVARIQGGLVFTHPDASYEIDQDCPFAWGTIAGWMYTLANAATIPGLSERATLQILDALLERHQEMSDDGRLLAMDAYARQLVRDTEARLTAFHVRA